MAALKPPRCSGCTITFPRDHIMLLTLSRPKQMNSINHKMNWELEALFTWYDNEPSLRCAVITGEGTKAFCAGSDLIEIEHTQKAIRDGLDVDQAEPWLHQHPLSGFAGVSRRKGKKPLLAAVNGVALGGGFEIVLNAYVPSLLLLLYATALTCSSESSDIVIASPKARFGLPEPQVGVYAYGGGLPRLVKTVGMQAACDIALAGKQLSAEEALSLRLVQGISKTPESVLEETLAKAQQIASISPDGIIVTRAALREAWETASVERAFQISHDNFFEKLMKSENSGEGLAAFREKRKPSWRKAKL